MTDFGVKRLLGFRNNFIMITGALLTIFKSFYNQKESVSRETFAGLALVDGSPGIDIASDYGYLWR